MSCSSKDQFGYIYVRHCDKPLQCSMSDSRISSLSSYRIWVYFDLVWLHDFNVSTSDCLGNDKANKTNILP